MQQPQTARMWSGHLSNSRRIVAVRSFGKVREMFRKAIFSSSLWIFAGCSAVGQTNQESDKSYQHFELVSIAGAKCVLKREGDEAIPLVLPDSKGGNLSLIDIRIDSTKNHNDISVTCTKVGYKKKSKVTSFGSVSYIDDFAPCVSTTNASDTKKNSCKKQPRSSTSVTLQYPDIIRVILEPSTD